MKKVFICNLLFLKRMIIRISFLVILLLLPILSVFLKHYVDNSTASTKIGLCSYDEGEYANKITKELLNNYSSVHFISYSSKDDLLMAMKNREIDTGYIFPENFSSQLLNRKMEQIVDLYFLSGTINYLLSNEYIYGEIFKFHALHTLVNFVEEKDYTKNIDKTQCKNDLYTLYDRYQNSDDTFSFTYINANHTPAQSRTFLASFLLHSVKGIVALYILIGALIGTMNLYTDEKHGIFYAINTHYQFLCKLADIFIVALLTALSGYFAQRICNLNSSLIQDIGHLVFYCLICTLFCMILHKLIKTTFWFCFMIPILLISCIVFCPIFINFCDILPFTKYIKWFFPPTYFY